MRENKVTANIWCKKGDSRSPFLLIELYLDGELSESEIREFEIMLKKVPGLKKEFELRKGINNSISDEMFIENLKKSL